MRGSVFRPVTAEYVKRVSRRVSKQRFAAFIMNFVPEAMPNNNNTNPAKTPQVKIGLFAANSKACFPHIFQKCILAALNSHKFYACAVILQSIIGKT